MQRLVGEYIGHYLITGHTNTCLTQDLNKSDQLYWVTLEPLNHGNAREIENLDRQRELVPQMGGVFQRGLPTKRCGDPLAIRLRRENTIVGVVANQELDDYPGVCHITIYVDQAITRPGLAIEAFFLYT